MRSASLQIQPASPAELRDVLMTKVVIPPQQGQFDQRYFSVQQNGQISHKFRFFNIPNNSFPALGRARKKVKISTCPSGKFT